MHETGCSGLVHWDDPEGWDGEGGGRGVQDGEHMYTPVADSCQYMAKPLQYCKVLSLQLKQINSFKKKKREGGTDWLGSTDGRDPGKGSPQIRNEYKWYLS